MTFKYGLVYLGCNFKMWHFIPLDQNKDNIKAQIKNSFEQLCGHTLVLYLRVFNRKFHSALFRLFAVSAFWSHFHRRCFKKFSDRKDINVEVSFQ